MAHAPWHTYQVLTKRPERMRAWIRAWPPNRILAHWTPAVAGSLSFAKRFAHVWLGVSVEDQETADRRILQLLQVPAAVHFVSAEPLLGRVDSSVYMHPRAHLTDGLWHDDCPCCLRRRQYGGTGGIDWVIVGGESGPGFRPMDPSWAVALREQAERAGVPFFYKQDAGRYPGRTLAYQPIRETPWAAAGERGGRA